MISLFDILIVLNKAQLNHKCPLISKDKSFLEGGQFAPAQPNHFDRRKVVNLFRRTLDILSGVSNPIRKRSSYTINFSNARGKEYYNASYARWIIQHFY